VPQALLISPRWGFPGAVPQALLISPRWGFPGAVPQALLISPRWGFPVWGVAPGYINLGRLPNSSLDTDWGAYDKDFFISMPVSKLSHVICIPATKL